MARQDDKQREIMRAAETLARTRRFHEIKLDDVARLAKVGKGTIYLHFQDKEELFFQTATHGFGELCRRVENAISADASFQEQLQAICAELSKFFKKREHLFRMMLESRGTESGETLFQRWMVQKLEMVSAVAGVIRRAQQAGTVRGDIMPDILAGYFLGMMRARFMDMPPPENGDEEAIRELIALFCGGVLAADSRRKNDRTNNPASARMP